MYPSRPDYVRKNESPLDLIKQIYRENKALTTV
jgi:hypothetical protein